MNNTISDIAEDLDVVMPMYNLSEDISSYSVFRKCRELL